MHRPVVITPPATLPVTLAEAKAHLSILPDMTNDDDLLLSMIGTTVDHLDGWGGILGRCIVEQTIRQDFDDFCSRLVLPLGPLLSVESVECDGIQIDTASWRWKTDAAGRSCVEFLGGFSADGPISVTYRAGHDPVPEDIRHAIKMLVAVWFEQRMEVEIGHIVAELPDTLNTSGLLSRYRRCLV